MGSKSSARKHPGSAADLKLLDQWIDEVYGLNKLVIARHSGKYKGPIPRPAATPIAQSILRRDDASAIAMVRAYIVKLQEHSRSRESHEFMHELAERLFKKSLPFGEPDLIWLAKQTAAAEDFGEWPLVGIVDALERFAQSHGMSKELKPAVEKMLSNVEKVALHKTERDVIPRLRRLVRAPTKGFSVDQGEPWARRVRRDVGKLNGAVRQRWNDLLCHAQHSTASKPSPEWMARARRLVNGVGAKHFANQIAIWFPLFAKYARIVRVKNWGSVKKKCWNGRTWLASRTHSC